MNEMVDENSAFHDAISILMSIKSNLGLLIHDEALEEIRPWRLVRWLAIREIATVVHTVANAASFSSAVHAVVSALEKGVRSVPKNLISTHLCLMTSKTLVALHE